jgi:hypothetical protein
LKNITNCFSEDDKSFLNKVTSLNLNYLSRYGLYQRDIDIKSSVIVGCLKKEAKVNL